MYRYGNADYIIQHFGVGGLQEVLNHFSAERGELDDTATIDDCFADVEYNVWVGTAREFADQTKSIVRTYNELLSDGTHFVYEVI